jgi:cell division protein FtsZ
MGDDVTQERAFAHGNDVLKNAVGGISDIIHIPGAAEKSTSKTSRP